MSLIYADNDPLAPAGQQRGRAFSPGDILRSQLEPVAPRPGKDTSNEGWFSLDAPVGPHPAPNRRPDVLRVETLLGKAGDYDITRTDGPTGWWGSRAEGAVRTYQKRKGLKVDGLLNPGGPTIASLEGDLADSFKGFAVPSLAEIDAHHDALKLGEPGLLTHKPPPLDITPPEGVAEGTQAANRRTAQFLLGRASDDGLDQFVARDIQDNGEAGILRNRDLVLQINELDPKRAHSFAWGILSHLPRETARDFLGGEVPDVPPVGIRKEDWRQKMVLNIKEPVPPPKAEPYYPDKDTGNHRMALNDAGEGGGAGGDAASGGNGKDGGSGNDANEPASTQPPENGDGAPGKDAGTARKPADGWVAGKSVDDLLKETKDGYLSSGPDAGSKQCVALVKHAIPDIGAAKDWKEGEKIKGPDDPPLAPGTAIATFKDGKYQNNDTGNHAAIVIKPGEQNGKKDYWVLDQNKNDAADKRFFSFNDPSRVYSSRMDNYSVIRKGK
ncbi:MAG: peptidoglycan-binding protein [Alphaproteobacteria bacterium]|nr:peptidoglycan-binding protein [Alphaproteobacteria bacterium]